MVILRGEIWWAELDPPVGSEAGYTRPVVIVQSDTLNQTSSRTTIIIPLTSNLDRAKLSLNVLIPAEMSKLERDSVAIIALIAAIDRNQLRNRVTLLPQRIVEELDGAMLITLGLS